MLIFVLISDDLPRLAMLTAGCQIMFEIIVGILKMK